MRSGHLKKTVCAFLAVYAIWAGHAVAATAPAPAGPEAKDPGAAPRQWVLKGLSQALSGNYDKAIEFYGKALDIDPQYARAYDFRGAAFLKKGDLDRAEGDFSKAISIYPDYPDYMDVYYSRGHVYIKKGLFDKAIDDFTKAIAMKPDYPGAFHGRAQAYSGKGQTGKAMEDLKKACKMGLKQACATAKGVIPPKGIK